MAAINDPNKLIKLPDELQLKMMESLSLKDLKNLHDTCEQFRTTGPLAQLAQLSTQLNKYTRDRGCNWCDRAITIIQTCYAPLTLPLNEVTRLVTHLGPNPSHRDFLDILTAVNCDKKIEPHPAQPCMCEIDG